MELPKNITQIGEANRSCKIYVEDYVVSYIKQVNQVACNKEMAVALYGTRKIENNITYLFIYGACKLNFLQRETRHLSQAQKQEIENLRHKYFQEYEFQGYRLLNGEMVEGFHVCEQDICRYVLGYAQFYEKNDSMLAYMLDTRASEATPEEIHQEKYDAVKKRQEERREESRKDEYRESGKGDYEEYARDRYAGRERVNAQTSTHGIRKMRISTAMVFGVLCLAGLAMLWDEQSSKDLQAAARQVMTELSEQKLPDAQEEVKVDENISTLIAEDKLSEAVLAENEPETESAPVPEAEPAVELTPVPTAEPENVPTPVPTPEPTNEPTPTPTVVPTETPNAQPVAYIIQQGDTLIDISLRQYGSDTMVKEICALNEISDPDDIEIGQKILLP